MPLAPSIKNGDRFESSRKQSLMTVPAQLLIPSHMASTRVRTTPTEPSSVLELSCIKALDACLGGGKLQAFS